MNQIKDLFSNYVLNVALISWLSAQILKTIINYFMTNKLNLERLFGAGGMPSAHSACVCAMTIAIARLEGVNSVYFAIAFIISSIVMYDAMGVRRAAGEQAKVINMIVKKHKDEKGVSYIPKNQDLLKEFLGHTPFEVLGGALLGILVAMLMPVF